MSVYQSLFHQSTMIVDVTMIAFSLEVFIMELINHEINRKEIYRYLGYKGQIPDPYIQNVIEEVIQTMVNQTQPRFLYQKYRCRVKDDMIQFLTMKEEKDVFSVESRNLANNLTGCEEVILLVATLGIEADKLLQRYSIMNMAKASIAQACGAACIEAFCNQIQEMIRLEEQKEGKFLRPRFSPGYGDLPLSVQVSVFAQLECTKRLGLTLTEDLLMYPTKSVSAFIGITNNRQDCHIDKCSTCPNTECEFRNEDS